VETMRAIDERPRAAAANGGDSAQALRNCARAEGRHTPPLAAFVDRAAPYSSESCRYTTPAAAAPAVGKIKNTQMCLR
jgi:hypothetical protein